MSQYISKRAINNIPLASKELTKDGGTLTSVLLKTNNYLNELAKGNPSYPPLEYKSSNEAVRRLKLALNTIDELNQVYPNFNIGFKLDTRSFEFNQGLEDAVKNFQGIASLTITGVVNSETLLKIDAALTGEMLFDNEYTKFIGVRNKKTFSFLEKLDSNNKYVYSVFVGESGSEIKVSLDNPLKATVVKKNSNKVYLKPNRSSKQELLNDSKIKSEIAKNSLIKINDGHNFNVILNLPIQIEIDAVYTSILDIDIEVENTPPQSFNDNGEKLYKIKPGDKLSNIIQDNYYGGGSYIIKNPYNNAELFTLPERSSLGPALRHEDARFQFYVNLIYYYNTQENSAGLKEWGVAKNDSYTRYNVDHLEAINIFDNKFNNTQPQSALPNYYRFLKRMESLDPGSKLTFDPVTGDCTSFDMQVGKNIRIPSKKFADSLYYFLNYRHNEMLREVLDPDSSGDTILDWVADNVIGGIINTMEDAMDSIAGLAQEVKQETIALYNETVEFFKAAYNFAIDFLTKYWPRGAGGNFEAGVGITWGIPVKTEIEYSRAIKRKMTKENELTIVYTKESALGLGVDIMAEGAQIGFYSGNGSKKKGFGLDYGLGVDAGVKFILGNEYEFPVRKDETALLTMIINVFGGELVKSTADILEYLDQINLNPRQYLTKFEVKAEGNTRAWGAAQLGLKVPQNTEETVSEQNINKSFGSIDNIFSKISDVGYAAELSVNTGVAFSYKVEYGNNPMVFEGNGARMFDKIELDIKQFVRGQLSTSKLGSFLGKIFASSALPGLDTVISMLNFDRGFMLGINYQLERDAHKEAITANDLKFVPLTSNISYLPQGGIAYSSANSNVNKSLSLYFGTYSGDVDTICQSGSEVKLSIDAYVLKDICFNSNYDFTFSNIYKLFKDFTYKKKVGILYEGQEKKKLIVKEKHTDNNVPSSINDKFRFYAGSSDNYEVELTTELLSACLKNSAKDKDFFLSTGIALSLQMTIEFELLEKLFKFYLKKLYLTYLKPDWGINRTNKEFIAVKEKIDKFLKTQPQLTGAAYYNALYSEGVIAGSPNIKGLLGWINGVVPNFDSVENEIRMKIVTKFLESVQPFNHYLNHKNSLLTKQNYFDFGFHDLFNWFALLAELGQLELALEAKLGVAFGGQLKGGYAGATAGIALNALAELNYQGEFYKEGKLVGLADTDPFKAVFNEIDQMLGQLQNNKRMGAKKLFSLIS